MVCLRGVSQRGATMGSMAFGQASGPPASRRQVDELLALVNAAGFDDFRDARHPLGFTQRQAAGKFTRDEADTFIESLSAESADQPSSADEVDVSPDTAQTPGSRSKPTRSGPVTAAERKAAAQARTIRSMPSELLAGELQRRGWAVIEP